MKRYDVVMVNMSHYRDWDKGIQNRNFHIFNTLKKDARIRKILCVDFLPFTVKIAVKSYTLGFIKNSYESQYQDFFNNVYQVDKKVFGYTSLETMMSEKRFIQKLKKILEILGFENTLLWSYNPLFTQIFKENENIFKIKVFDCVDNWLEHPAYTNMKDQLYNGYETISKLSDAIFTTAKEMNDWLDSEFGRSTGVSFIENGIFVDDFNKKQSHKQHPYFFTHQIDFGNKPIVGYIGTIENRFDIDLLKYLLEKNPDKIFVIAGPIWKNAKKKIDTYFKNFHNIYFPGRIKRGEWSDFCQNFDVCLNIHKLNGFIKYTSPTKVFEYLACNKPVVSTNVSGIKNFTNGVFIGNTYKECHELLQKALENDYSDLSLQKYAFENFPWEKRVASMLEQIFKT